MGVMNTEPFVALYGGAELVDHSLCETGVKGGAASDRSREAFRRIQRRADVSTSSDELTTCFGQTYGIVTGKPDVVDARRTIDTPR